MRYLWRYVLAFACLGSIAYASSVDISQTDFSERAINFVIFVAILWYLAADKLKALLKNRQQGIASRFEEVQDKVKAAKKSREQAQKNLEEAQKKAAEIVSTAKKEAVIVAQKYEEQCNADIENMKKSHDALMHFEQRKAQAEVVESVLDEVFGGEAGKIQTEEYVRILNKKVA